MAEGSQTAHTERVIARVDGALDRQAVRETQWAWGAAADRSDLDGIRRFCTDDLHAMVYVRGEKMHEVNDLETYLKGWEGVFTGGVRAAIHAYSPDMVVEVMGDEAHARFSSHNTHAFDQEIVETAVGFADSWFRRDESAPFGWRCSGIEFHYEWGDKSLRALFEAGLLAEDRG